MLTFDAPCELAPRGPTTVPSTLLRSTLASARSALEQIAGASTVQIAAMQEPLSASGFAVAMASCTRS